MAWTTQYYHEFYDQSGQACRIDIKEDAAAGNTLLDAAVSPVRLIRPEKDFLDPIKGSGAEITFLSETDRQLIGLFTADMNQYRVELRIAGTLQWFGYLNSEMYRESYSEVTNYFVNLAANNGFSLLERIKLLDGSGDPYTGLQTQWEVIKVILGKWGLMDLVSLVFVGIATTSTEITIGAQETIFHHQYISYANYYDEDGDPSSCRKVLEDILRSLGAVIMVVGYEIIIVDIESLAGDISWKVYNNDFSWYGSDSDPAASVDELETIGYFQTGSDLDVVAGINRQVIRYSKYTLDVVESYIQDQDKFTYSSGSSPNFVQISDIYGSTSYLTDNITGLENWSFTGAGSLKISGAKENVNDEGEFFIHKYCQNIGQDPIDESFYDDDHSTWSPPAPYVIGDDGYYIKITGKVFPLTRPDPYVEPNGSFTDDAYFNYVAVLARLRIGTFMYSPGTLSWITTPGTYTTDHQFRIFGGSPDGNAKNKWNDFQVIPWAFSRTKKHPFSEDAVYIYVEPGVYGKIELDLTMMDYAYVGSTHAPAQTAKLRNIFLKDIQIQVVSNPGFQELSDTDIEYVGELDQTWKNEGSPVTLNHGCSSPNGTPFDNAGLIYKDGSNDYYFMTEWTRGGQTDVIEKLLLNTIQSNRETAAVKLSVNINNITGRQSLRYIDTPYMSGKMFMVTGSKLDIAEGSEEITLLEIKQDTHTIS